MSCKLIVNSNSSYKLILVHLQVFSLSCKSEWNGGTRRYTIVLPSSHGFLSVHILHQRKFHNCHFLRSTQSCSSYFWNDVYDIRLFTKRYLEHYLGEYSARNCFRMQQLILWRYIYNNQENMINYVLCGKLSLWNQLTSF